MSFLPTRSTHSSGRAPISCSRCGRRIRLSDQIHKDGEGFAHELCPDDGTTARVVPGQRHQI